MTKDQPKERELKTYEIVLGVTLLIAVFPLIFLVDAIRKIRLFKGELCLLLGKEMPCTYWGMRGCVRGIYCQNSETYYYGIKGLIGLEYHKQWGKNWY